MMPKSNITPDSPDAYLELKIAWEMFRKTPGALTADDQREAGRIAARQRIIEQRILSSPEASTVVIPGPVLEARLLEIRRRYPDETAFAQDMAQQQISLEALQEALLRDLRIEAVLDRIAALTPPATEVDAELFYRLNPKAFDRPEIRTLRHILITAETDREKTDACITLMRLRGEIRSTEDFSAAALRHSQCPTAMEGGLLGRVRPGQLYPELDPVAFSLALGVISEVVASPMGLHLLRCEAIQPGQMLAFPDVKDRIIGKLDEQRRTRAQQDWIKRLPPG